MNDRLREQRMPKNEKDWRELCAAAAEEPDSEKLISIVNQILEAFDTRDRAVARAHTQSNCVRQPLIPAE